MLSKIGVRRIIENTKDNYTNSGDKTLFVDLVLLKGLYIAIGGTKGIPTPSKFDKITSLARIVFKYYLKSKESTDKTLTRAFDGLYDGLCESGIIPEDFIIDIPTTEEDIAGLLASLVVSFYVEDMLVNYNNIYNKTLKIIREVDL